MKKLLLALQTALVIMLLAAPTVAWCQSDLQGYEQPPYSALLSPDELDDLLAPIALYPDPLIAQILPAATFADQIDEAARYVRTYGQTGIDYQPWDVSVKAVAHYPSVLFMMDQRYDWTVALGQAFIEQQQDVMDAIQRLRAEAEETGNLVSTREQQVIIDDGYIRIVPAQPEYIYVPVYDPQVVYVEPPPAYPFITFGAGFVIGAWLSRDCDWHRHRVFYHGWRERTGWVGRARPHIHDRNSIYISRNASTIRVNRRVMQHDTHQFRQQIRQDAVRHRELRQREPARENRPRPEGRPRTEGRRPPAGAVVPQRPEGSRRFPPGRPEREAQPRRVEPARPAAEPVRPAPAPPRPALTRPENRDVFRGRDVQRTRPPSQSGYGGYGSGRDATIYRERGRSSRENMTAPPPTRPAPTFRQPQPSPPLRQPEARPAAPPMRREAPPAAAPMRHMEQRQVAPPTPRPAAPTPRPAAPPPRPAQPPSSPAPPPRSEVPERHR